MLEHPRLRLDSANILLHARGRGEVPEDFHFGPCDIGTIVRIPSAKECNRWTHFAIPTRPVGRAAQGVLEEAYGRSSNKVRRLDRVG